jgi:hypothetical protein
MLSLRPNFVYLCLVKVTSQISVLIVIPSGVEKLDRSVGPLSEDALARESKDVSYFEFLSVTMPLIERLEYLRTIFEIVYSPQTYNAGIAGLRRGGKDQAAKPQRDRQRWNYLSVMIVTNFHIFISFLFDVYFYRTSFLLQTYRRKTGTG